MNAGARRSDAAGAVIFASAPDPWRNGFGGSFGNLKVLATAADFRGVERPVILEAAPPAP